MNGTIPCVHSRAIWRIISSGPVSARAPHAWYRARKFLRRQWLPVSAAALLVVAISTSAVVAARAARAESQKSAEVNHFLNGILSSASQIYFDPARYTVAEMLDSAARSWQSILPAMLAPPQFCT
jgi:eukaryotic-like serine/threonine-protein kinase